MPNPNGTLTRDELKSRLIVKVVFFMVEEGMDLAAAITRASDEMKTEIETAWAIKTAQMLKDQGMKPQ